MLHFISRAASLFRLEKTSAFFQRRTRLLIRKKKHRYLAKKYFHKQSFDVIVANTVPYCSEIAQYISAEKKYVVFHTSRADSFPDITRRAFSRFQGVVAVSEGGAQLLKQTYPEYAGKIRTITNYVDAEGIWTKAKEYTPALPADRLLLCSCGRLSREKGFDLAVEAARLLKERQLAFVWYFVGDGDRRQELEAMIAEYHLNDNIVITGFLQNPYPYIASCDIYVQPSYEEARPLAVMEALVLGCAVVATETVGSRSVLQDGQKGILTPISAEGLADGLLKYAYDETFRRSFSNQYSSEDDLKDRKEFAAAWQKLLSE